ncbi:hypothetical protein J3459_016046 [Metarhizium acridum]|nr:hypothetical protein J3459_016046 [Metarhizium acridum]
MANSASYSRIPLSSSATWPAMPLLALLGRIRPSEEQLGEMDRAAEDNTWHDKPDFSKENLRKQAKGIYGGSPKKDAQDIANSTTNAALPQGVDSGRVDTVAAQSAVQQKVDEKIDPETKEQIKKSKEEYRRRAKDTSTRRCRRSARTK